MRVNARTKAADQLAHYVGQLVYWVLGDILRDTQNYVQLACAWRHFIRGCCGFEG